MHPCRAASPRTVAAQASARTCDRSPLAFAFAVLLSGCANQYSGPGAWLTDGDELSKKGQCGRAISHYASALERSIPASYAPDRVKDPDSLSASVDKIKRLAPTCTVQDAYSINTVGATLGTLAGPDAKGQYQAEATDMANAFLAFAANNPNVVFDSTYGIRYVIGFAEANSDTPMLQRAVNVWFRQASWQNDTFMPAVLQRHPAELADMAKAIDARLALTAKLSSKADKMVDGRCDSSKGALGCKGGDKDGDPNYIAYSRNKRDWYLAYAKLMIENSFPAGMTAFVKGLAAKEDKDFTERLARQNAPAPAPARKTADTSTADMMSTIGTTLKTGASFTKGSSASQMAAMGNAFQNQGRTMATQAAATNTAAPQNTVATTNASGNGAPLRNSPYAGQFAQAPTISDDLCSQSQNSASARFEAWLKQVGASASGVCTSAKAANVINTKWAEVIRYCLARTTDATRRQQGQQELAEAERTAREAAQTAAQSCS